ncbi:MAG: hypothetical protein ABSA18_17365 [Dehalococcoidia bacterium]
MLFLGMIILAVIFLVIQNDIKKSSDKIYPGVRLTYEGGHPDLRGPVSISLMNDNDKIILQCIKLPYKNVVLQKTNIKDIKLVLSDNGVDVVEGAIVGDLLLGPVGALLGGAAAEEDSNTPLLQMVYLDSGITYELYFIDDDIMNKLLKVKQLMAT